NREDLAEFLDCNPLLFFKYEEQFNALLDRGLLENETKFRVAILRKRKIYRIADELHFAILHNEKIEPYLKNEKTDPVELFIELAEIIHDMENEEVDTKLLLKAVNDFFRNYLHIP